MPRAPRLQISGGVYHVTQRATGHELLFMDRIDRQRFDRLLLRAARRFSWDLHDYCQMTNHFHLLLLTREPNIARGMQYLIARHVESFNRRHDRRGTLVQGRYYSGLIETEEHHLVTRAYLALNAVDANLCDEPDDWPWCGFGGRGRVVPEPDERLRRFVADYRARRRRIAVMSFRDMSEALTPGYAQNRRYALRVSPTAPGHSLSGVVERTTCAPVSAKRANAASASSV